MTDNPVIDPACVLGSSLTDADLKSIFTTIPQITIDNGFGCDSAGAAGIDNMRLGAWMTALFATPTRALSILHQNEAFSQCIWDNFICQKVNDKFFFQVISGQGGNGTITLPAGTWLPFGIAIAGSDNDPLINVGDFVGHEADDEDDNYFVFIAPNAPRAGGTSYNISSINPQVTDDVDAYSFALFAINLDCA